MKAKQSVYLDNASTTPIDGRVLSVMFPYLKSKCGNPSSLHYEGRIAKKAVEDSRINIAKVLGANNNEIIFTSGGTESDNLAIFGLARANKSKGKHIIVSCIEHKAVLDSCKRLENEGFEVTYLDVDKKGIVSLNQLKEKLKADTILVSIMYANNEIGTIQPIKKISKIIKGSKISKPIFHCDACQAVGTLTINTKDIGVDALTISSSKIYGPKGVGCLYLDSNCQIEPIIFGGGQEKGLRSGTENVASIVGFAKALSLSEMKKKSEGIRLIKLRNYFLSKIIKKIKGVSVNGDMNNRLPNNLNVSIKGVEGESLVLFLDREGICCSTGSACSSLDLNPSHVLMSIKIPIELAHCNIRFTLGRFTKKVDIDYTVNVLSKSIERIREMSF